MTAVLDRRVFPPGRTIVRAGQPVGHVVLIARGTCRVVPEGMERSYVFGPGALLGFKPIAERQRQPVFGSTATAVDAVESVFIEALRSCRSIRACRPG